MRYEYQILKLFFLLNLSPSESDHVNLCLQHTKTVTRRRLFGRPQMLQSPSSPALFKEVLLFEIATYCFAEA